jgi:hypothetical protein
MRRLIVIAEAGVLILRATVARRGGHWPPTIGGFLTLVMFLAIMGCGGGSSPPVHAVTAASFNGTWYSDGTTYGGISGTGVGTVRLEYTVTINDGSSIVYTSTTDGTVLGTATLQLRFSVFQNKDVWYAVDTTGTATSALELHPESGELIIGMEGPDAVSSGFMRGHAN